MGPLLRLSLELQRRLLLNAKCLERHGGSDSVIADKLIRIFTWSHPCCAKSSAKHRATLPHAAVMSNAFCMLSLTGSHAFQDSFLTSWLTGVASLYTATSADQRSDILQLS